MKALDFPTADKCAPQLRFPGAGRYTAQSIAQVGGGQLRQPAHPFTKWKGVFQEELVAVFPANRTIKINEGKGAHNFIFLKMNSGTERITHMTHRQMGLWYSTLLRLRHPL